ncbi:MAG: hypothetical protein ABSA53_21590 [Streptosporangiaceae bacterium]
MDRLDLRPGLRITDLGCARTVARQRHLDQHVEFTQADAAAWRGAADRAPLPEARWCLGLSWRSSRSSRLCTLV